jgi:Zn-finger nucleic acid-binding protein
MHCPVCKTTVLATQPLDENLLTLRCPKCEGHWVKSFQYWKWRESQPGTVAVDACDSGVETTDTDSKAGKLCPECGRFLMHRPVGHGVEFNLDRCGHCGGMWFDKLEWDAMQRNSLNRDAHYIFTDSWQSGLKGTKRLEAERARLTKLLGERDYSELMRVARWVRSHEQSTTLLAILNNADPDLIVEE